MPIDVTRNEYLEALTQLLDHADPVDALFARDLSACALSHMLIWAYDTLETDIRLWIPFVAEPWRQIVWRVIVGRLHYGRPGDHPRYQEILDFRDWISFHRPRDDRSRWRYEAEVWQRARERQEQLERLRRDGGVNRH